jgi:hypothetical protein
MKIQPIVEGHGEVHAVPVLLRRLRDAGGIFAMSFLPPIRKTRSELVRRSSLQSLIRQALTLRNPDGLLILFDADDDCPRELAPRAQGWAAEEAGTVPCAVVLANREFEAWFLATLDSLQGRRGIGEHVPSNPDAESVRGAKERLSDAMGPGRTYSETRDQAALTAVFDLAAAHRVCRSFRRMVRAFGLVASGAGAELGEWPPPSWPTGG